MNTNILKTAIAALALLVAFNSCKEKDEDYGRLVTNEELEQLVLMEDGHVVTSLDGLESQFCDVEKSKSMYGHWMASYYVGTSPNSLERYYGTNLEPYTKYYWKIRLLDTKKSSGGGLQWDSSLEYAETEPRSFYYIPTPQIRLHNVEGDWATVLKWDNKDVFEDAQVTMTPNKDCNYDKNLIKVPAGQDSCYISAGTLDNQKYQIYHSWWDEAHGKYYEPVIYDYKVTINCNIGGDIVPISASTKGIFLNTDGYVSDSSFNVYRFAKIGNRTWMLDDIRARDERLEYWEYCIDTLDSGLEMVLYRDKFVFERGDMIIPKGFHLATDEDWQDLEAHYGVERADVNSYSDMGMQWEGSNYLSDTTNSSYQELKEFYNIYVGSETNIRDYLITDNEWRDYKDTTKTLKGTHIFNAHPTGIPTYFWSGYGGDYYYRKTEGGKGYGTCFLTSTIINDSYVKRILCSGSTGIGRVLYFNHLLGDIDYYLLRCVKDE